MRTFINPNQTDYVNLDEAIKLMNLERIIAFVNNGTKQIYVLRHLHPTGYGFQRAFQEDNVYRYGTPRSCIEAAMASNYKIIAFDNEAEFFTWAAKVTNR